MGLKVPAPPLQVPVVALPPINPARVTELPAQTDWSTPAFAVGAAFTVTVTVPEAVCWQEGAVV